MSTRSALCPGCGSRTTASSGVCRTCQGRITEARRRIDDERLAVAEAGGLWWVWDANGDVLVAGKPTKAHAIRALAWGDDEDEDDDDESRHAAETRRAGL